MYTMAFPIDNALLPITDEAFVNTNASIFYVVEGNSTNVGFSLILQDGVTLMTDVTLYVSTVIDSSFSNPGNG